MFLFVIVIYRIILVGITIYWAIGFEVEEYKDYNSTQVYNRNYSLCISNGLVRLCART
jgi:hypothetical protein